MLIELSAHGDVQVSRRLLRFGERAINAAPAFEFIATELMRIEREQFDTEGQRSSGGWAPLAESTLAQKTGPSILVESGELKASLTERGHPSQRLIISDTFMVFGSEVDYAAYHQRGTAHMPRRRPLELTEHDRAHTVVRTLQRWITTGELIAA